MARESKYKFHSESKFPSRSPLTYPLYLNQEPKVTGSTAATRNPDFAEKYTIESLEVESLIHKLQRFSISHKKFDKSQGRVTSQYNLTHPLTRLKSEKFCVQPTE